MPLEIEHRGSRARPAGHSRDGVTIGLLNNMPDAALEATELQFGALLSAAAGARTVRLRFSSLPELSRTGAARARIDCDYWPLDELLSQRPDALIVTGTEPRTPALEEEPYWQRLVRLIEWAETHTASSIWSCLAAHALAQALCGVRRRRLPQKRFGVFGHRIAADTPLLAGVRAPLLTPHSRWNELPVADLESAGFAVLSASKETGADLFVRSGRSLLVCFQGHPEYDALTLLKEYRRDVGRFLRGEQPAWPNLPQGYFDGEALRLIAAFRERADCARDPQLLAEFPMGPLAAGLEARWQPGAAAIYRNWLQHVATAKERTRKTASVGV
ncbi:MAG: homoserine O-succinyltransferase [Gammaproteobacteria bacterium]|nr:homoserine O-succinyltransferase [Gammaproteobacteria bacterium]